MGAIYMVEKKNFNLRIVASNWLPAKILIYSAELFICSPTSQLCENVVILLVIVQYFSDPTVLDELDLDEKTKSTLLSNIMRRLTPQAVKIRADIEVSCYAYDGIDAVKNSLLEGLKCSSEDVPIKVSRDLLDLVVRFNTAWK